MVRFASVVALATFVVSAFGLPTPLVQLTTVIGDKQSNSYIVHLKDTADKGNVLSWLGSQFKGSSQVTHPNWSPDVLNGFAATLGDDALKALRASPDVDFISEDAIMHSQAVTTQSNAPWGVSRLSQSTKETDQNAADLTFKYRYDSKAGAGVDIYIVDTGINTDHNEFGGRARLGAVFGSPINMDDNGHGTHVSGTAAGSTYGVAKGANLIAVKVLNAVGSGANSDIISGLNYVLNSAKQSKRPSVASMSLGGGASTSLDTAVRNLVNNGIHVTVAAGNANTNSKNTSPARVDVANTIGASTIADARASFSNYGSVVDIFAPGQDVISAWIGTNMATKSLSGTSMATPHVAGLIAYLISVKGNMTPANMSKLLHTLGTDRTLSGIPFGTNNELARNDE